MKCVSKQKSNTLPENSLDIDPSQYPPTLGDFVTGVVPSTRGKLVRKIENTIRTFESTLYDFSGLPTALSAGRELKSIHFARQLNTSLPRTIPGESHHVYVVTSPHVGWLISHRHWSIYSQGYFYHLSANIDDSNNSPECKCNKKIIQAAAATTVLKIEDLSSPQSRDFINIQNDNVQKKKAFLAFEVGQNAVSTSRNEECG